MTLPTNVFRGSGSLGLGCGVISGDAFVAVGTLAGRDFDSDVFCGAGSIAETNCPTASSGISTSVPHAPHTKRLPARTNTWGLRSA